MITEKILQQTLEKTDMIKLTIDIRLCISMQNYYIQKINVHNAHLWSFVARDIQCCDYGKLMQQTLEKTGTTTNILTIGIR